MTLAAFQHVVKNLLMTPEGKAALDSPEALQKFVEASALDAREKRMLISQSLPRLQQYQYMLLANVRETLESIFPLTRSILRDDWPEVVQQYFWQHPPASYRLMLAGKAFVQFLGQVANVRDAYPFLPDLALYEWLEAELLSAPDPVYPAGLVSAVPQTDAALHAMAPVVNRVSSLIQLAYPIPRLVEHLQAHGVSGLTEGQWQPDPVVILVYRSQSPYRCRFFQLTPLLAAWLSVVKAADDQGQNLTYQQTLDPLYAQIREAVGREAFNREFLGILGQLLEQGVLLGSVDGAVVE